MSCIGGIWEDHCIEILCVDNINVYQSILSQRLSYQDYGCVWCLECLSCGFVFSSSFMLIQWLCSSLEIIWWMHCQGLLEKGLKIVWATWSRVIVIHTAITTFWSSNVTNDIKSSLYCWGFEQKMVDILVCRKFAPLLARLLCLPACAVWTVFPLHKAEIGAYHKWLFHWLSHPDAELSWTTKEQHWGQSNMSVTHLPGRQKKWSQSCCAQIHCHKNWWHAWRWTSMLTPPCHELWPATDNTCTDSSVMQLRLWAWCEANVRPIL